MGSNVSREVIQVSVPQTGKNYPLPTPPKFLLPDHVRNPLLVEAAEDEFDDGFDWSSIVRALKADKNNVTQSNGTETDNKQDEPDVTDQKQTKPLVNGSAGRTSSEGDPEPGHNSGNSAKGVMEDTDEKKDDVDKWMKPLVTHKISFDSIDNHARSTTPQQSETYSGLIAHLQQQIKDPSHPEMFLARALLAWLGAQSYERLPPGTPTVSTPLGLLHHLKQKSITFVGAFTLLCRAAKIPCTIIPGCVKAETYEPGDIVEDKASDSWCSVYVDGDWQLIHPLWVCRGLYIKAKDGFVQLEADDAMAKRFKTQDKNPIIFNEEYFMPKPEEFIFRCYALDIQWHLLPIQRTIKSSEEFTRLAFASPTFFKLGLKLKTPPLCVLHAVDGVVTIEIVAPKEIANKIRFLPHLKALDVVDKSHAFLRPGNIERLVLSYRSNDHILFETRLPTEGTFSFEIKGGFKDLFNMLKFQFSCSRRMRHLSLFPVDSGIAGWGPGPEAERAGLLLPSRPSGIVSVHPTNTPYRIHPTDAHEEDIVTITFQLGRNCLTKHEFTAELLQSNSQRNPELLQEGAVIGGGKLDKETRNKIEGNTSFPECLECKYDHKESQLDIRLTVPEDGEYALVIKVTDMEIKNNEKIVKKGTTRPACYYLLTTGMQENTQKRLAKVELQRAMDINDVTDIRRSLAKCAKMKVPSTDDELAAGNTRLEYLTMRKDILDCVKRRNVSVVNDVLRRVLKYRYRNSLVTEVEKLLQFKEELIALNGYTTQLPSLRDALEELYKASKPLPEVENTLRALCMLLGFTGKLDKWSFIHSKLSVTSDTVEHMHIMKRIEYMESPSFPWKRLDEKDLTDTEHVLLKYSYEHVKRSSQSAATFYKWVDTMLTKAAKMLEEPKPVVHLTKKQQRRRLRQQIAKRR